MSGTQSRFGLDYPNHSVAARTLPLGMDEDDFLYCYFPMPFKQRGKIELVAGNIPAETSIEYEIQYKIFKDSFKNVGYFKAHEYYANKLETDTSNMTPLDVTGSGKLMRERTGARHLGPGATADQHTVRRRRPQCDARRSPGRQPKLSGCLSRRAQSR